MSPEEFRYGLENFSTRQETDPRQFAINFRNSLIFLVPENDPKSMVPLAWAMSATRDGWEHTTRSMNSGNARMRAEAAGLERIEAGHPQHDTLWQAAIEKAMALTRQHLSPSQLGFSRHHGHPRSAAENSFYVLPEEAPQALDPGDLNTLAEHEGSSRQVTVNRYERKARLRNACIAFHRSQNAGALKCVSCDFDFEATYGELGAGFIHIHHIDPLGNRQEERLVDPKKHLIPLCPNCHAMVHRGLAKDESPRSPRELIDIRRKL